MTKGPYRSGYQKKEQSIREKRRLESLDRTNDDIAKQMKAYEAIQLRDKMWAERKAAIEKQIEERAQRAASKNNDAQTDIFKKDA